MAEDTRITVGDGPTTHERFARTKHEAPGQTKRCATCQVVQPTTQFPPRARGKYGVAANCLVCIQQMYVTGTFICSRCRRARPGGEFQKGSAGSIVMQPCKECMTADQREKTRERRVTQGREPYHLLSDIDVSARTATCRECGPTHIHATGAKGGRGWRCGRRADQVSSAWYDANATVVNKHGSRLWHRLTEVSGQVMLATCSQCGPNTPVRWSNSTNRFHCNSPWRRRPRADVERERRWLRKYGLTPDGFAELNAAQGGLCAICGSDAVLRTDSDGTLYVDHDHKTGEVRGLLCALCNSGLGSFRDRSDLLNAAVEYLARAARMAGR
jgi:Recombination endonuclease VII